VAAEQLDAEGFSVEAIDVAMEMATGGDPDRSGEVAQWKDPMLENPEFPSPMQVIMTMNASFGKKQ